MAFSASDPYLRFPLRESSNLSNSCFYIILKSVRVIFAVNQLLLYIVVSRWPLQVFPFPCQDDFALPW